MDADLRELLRAIRAVAPEIADWLERLWRGGYTRGEQRALARSIAEASRHYPGLTDKILRALAMILRALGVPMPTLGAGGAVVAGGGTVGGGTVGGGTAGGTAAGAGGAGLGMTIGAALFMLMAIGVLTYRTYRELNAEIDVGDASGSPCSGGNAAELMATLPRQLQTSAWSGRTDSMQQAIDEAWTDAARMRDNCGGRCPPGRHCMPVVAIQEIDQWSHFPWNTTYTRITYTLPCFCVLPDAYWAQFRWDMLPQGDQRLWEALGRNEDNWDDGGQRERKPWDQLSREERAAADALGFDETSWSPEPADTPGP